jgi:GTP cyclohydrolase I
MHSTATPASPQALRAAADHLRQAFALLGLEGDPEMAHSPERVAELLSTFAPRPLPETDPLPALGHNELIVLRDLPFHSVCAHHLLPFFGTVTLAFRPRGHLVGLGWLSATVAACAHRPQLQERLAGDILEAIEERLHPSEAGVRIVARQLCVEMRGPRSAGTFEVLRATPSSTPELRAALR